MKKFLIICKYHIYNSLDSDNKRRILFNYILQINIELRFKINNIFYAKEIQKADSGTLKTNFYI
jgi:hypothetical protein